MRRLLPDDLIETALTLLTLTDYQLDTVTTHQFVFSYIFVSDLVTFSLNLGTPKAWAARCFHWKIFFFFLGQVSISYFLETGV